MTIQRRFHVLPSAEAEVAEAITWYEAKKPGLGRELLVEIEQAFRQIQAAPETWPLWRADRPYRRRLLPRFPYEVLFVVTATDIVVEAVAHMKRRPGYWLRRR